MTENDTQRLSLAREGTSLTWKGDLQKAGAWRLDVRYNSGGELARRTLSVDGLAQGDVQLPATGGTKACHAAVTLELSHGPHAFTLAGDWGTATIEGLELMSVPARATPPFDFAMGNPDATREARQVMAYLRSVHGRAILTGQHTGMATGPEIRHIENHTGRRPAVRGFDFLGYSSGVIQAATTDESKVEADLNQGSVEEAIRWWRERQGLVTFCWHWYSPLGAGAKGFYTKNTTFDLRAALVSGTAGYEGLLKDMDIIAGHLTRLRDEGVPVLWRPLHEADGGWFWWGASGAEPYLRLYRWMHERFTAHHRLHNLIWVWNAPAPGWYPGDDVVDIAGSDTYAPGGNPGPLTASYDLVLGMAGGRKPVALSENGPIPDPEELRRSRTSWLWFMTWAGMVMDKKTVPWEHLKRVFNHPYAITSAQLPTWLFA